MPTLSDVLIVLDRAYPTRLAEPWDTGEIETAEVLLKRLRRGAEPHASLLEALEANRYADGAPPNPTPT